MEIKTLKGTWVEVNKFIDHKGVVHKVGPYSWIYEQYKDKLPLTGYINIEDNTIISVLAQE